MTETAPAATAAKAVAGAFLRHILAALGIWLVRNGMLDQQAADSATGPIADYILGAGIASGAAGWSMFRARLMHSRWVQAWLAPARPLLAVAPPIPLSSPVQPRSNPMTIKTFIVKAEETALAALKTAGTILEHFVVSEVQSLVAEVKTTPLGTTAMNIVSALTAHSGSGEEKMEMLIASVTPALTKLKAAGGLNSLGASIEDFAKEFGQSVYNDFKAASAPLVLKAADELHA